MTELLLQFCLKKNLVLPLNSLQKFGLMVRFFLFSTAIACTVLFQGCVVCKLPDNVSVSGQVLDQITHKPIQRASVVVKWIPESSTQTDENGCFYVPAFYHWTTMPIYLPAHHYLQSTILVEKDGYHPLVEKYANFGDYYEIKNKNFYLTRKKRLNR